ncbi:MAG: hypothetical protein ABMA02_14505, partial [Saprospiraceae bacterium]
HSTFHPKSYICAVTGSRVKIGIKTPSGGSWKSFANYTLNLRVVLKNSHPDRVKTRINYVWKQFQEFASFVFGSIQISGFKPLGLHPSTKPVFKSAVGCLFVFDGARSRGDLVQSEQCDGFFRALAINTNEIGWFDDTAAVVFKGQERVVYMRPVVLMPIAVVDVSVQFDRVAVCANEQKVVPVQRFASVKRFGVNMFYCWIREWLFAVRAKSAQFANQIPPCLRVA